MIIECGLAGGTDHIDNSDEINDHNDSDYDDNDMGGICTPLLRFWRGSQTASTDRLLHRVTSSWVQPAASNLDCSDSGSKSELV